MMVRDYLMKKLMYRWYFFLVAIYMASLFCFKVIFESLYRVVNSEGKTLDQFGIGMAMLSCFVLWLHITFLGSLRDWNILVKIAVSILLSIYPLSLLIASRAPGISLLYKHGFEIMSLPLFWLAIIPTVALMVTPFYLERIYMQVYLYPQFYQH